MIKDLINAIKNHENKIKNLQDLKSGLEELDNMIGIESVKNTVEEIVCESIINNTEVDTGHHCIVTGPPGSGKSTFIKILAKIMLALNIIKNKNNTNDLLKILKHKLVSINNYCDHIIEDIGTIPKRIEWIKTVAIDLTQIIDTNNSEQNILNNHPKIIYCSRADLVGTHQGETSKNVKDFFQKAKGGVLVIDEAYTLNNGNKDDADNYSVEAVDTLNQLMSEQVDTIVILAGYKREIETRLFALQKGLASRIQYKFDMGIPTKEQLVTMFKSHFTKIEVSDEVLLNLIKEKSMLGYGRLVSKWAKQTSLLHAKRRIFNGGDENLTLDDINQALSRISLPKRSINTNMYL